MNIYIHESGRIMYDMLNSVSTFNNNMTLETGIRAFLIKNYDIKIIESPATSQYGTARTFIQITVDDKIHQIIKALDETASLARYSWEDPEVASGSGIPDNMIMTQNTFEKMVFKNINNPDGLIKDTKPVLDIKAIYDEVLGTLLKNKPATAKVNTIAFTITPHRFRSTKLGFVDLNMVGERFKCSFTYAKLDSTPDLYQILAPPHLSLGRLIEPFQNTFYRDKRHHMAMITKHNARFESDGFVLTPKEKGHVDKDLKPALSIAAAHDLPLTSVLSLRS